MYFKIIFKEYFKNFLIVFGSLILFFVFIDFVMSKQNLPDSANLQFLYIFYKSTEASFLLYPLSLLLGMIATILAMVKKNEIVAFLSLGYSPKKLLLPIMSVAVLISSFFIFLQFTKVALFPSMGYAILDGKYSTHINNNLFFKFNNNVIYIKKLDLIQKIAYDMKIYVLKNHKIIETYEVNKIKFKNNGWYSNNIIKQYIKNDIVIRKKVSLVLLKGFKPDILNKLESKGAMSLNTAIHALILLNKEKLNTNFVKTYIYYAIIPPLSFVLLIFIMFLNAPIHSRISNVALYIAISLFSAILLWGVFLLVRKMAISGILSADVVFLTPFSILFVLAIYYFKKI